MSMLDDIKAALAKQPNWVDRRRLLEDALASAEAMECGIVVLIDGQKFDAYACDEVDVGQCWLIDHAAVYDFIGEQHSLPRPLPENPEVMAYWRYGMRINTPRTMITVTGV